MLLSTANTALRFRDAGSLKVFKLKLKEIEKLFYPGYRVVDAWIDKSAVGGEIDPDEVLEDPPHTSSDSASWSLPEMPAAIADRRKLFGPIGGSGTIRSRTSSAESSRKEKSSSSRRRRRHSSGSSSADTVRRIKAISLKDPKGEKTDDKKDDELDDIRDDAKGKDEEKKGSGEDDKKVEVDGDEKKGGDGEKKKKKKKKGGGLPEGFFEDLSGSSSDSSSDSEDERKSKARYPGFDDPPPGVTLRHASGGYLCGGWGDSKRVGRFMKATEMIKFDETKKGTKECLTYLQNEARFNTIIKGMITRKTTIYDLLCVFNNKCTHWRHTLEPLLQKHAHFTSFRDFQRAFQLKKWPMIREESRAEALNCTQKEDEEIGQYYEKWSDLQRLMAWELNDRTDSFINGLRNLTIKRLISLENYSGTTRTIDDVRDHAIYLAGRMQLTEGGDGSRRRTIAATSTVPSASRSSQRRKAKMPRAEASSEPSTSAAATSVEDRIAQSKKWARKLGLVGACWGCMRFHSMSPDFSTCERRCIFCERSFTKNERHLPHECRQKPQDKAIVAMWKKIKAEAKQK